MGEAVRCRPGDLALVVRVKHNLKMLGRLVIVERAPTPGELVIDTQGRRYGIDNGHHDWLVSAASGGPLPTRLSDGEVVDMMLSPCGDWNLFPIRPGGLGETLENEKELET